MSELDLIDFKNISIDGTFFKANASISKLIRIEELIYLENLINNFYNVENKENLLFKIQKYYLGNILDETNKKIITEIKNTLKKEGIKILHSALMNPSEKNSALNVINNLKSNYDGEHTISVD